MYGFFILTLQVIDNEQDLIDKIRIYIYEF